MAHCGGTTESGVTPVDAVHVRLPSLERPEAASSSAYITYDPTQAKEIPPFLTNEYRRKHLVNLLQCYDPDLVFLNEVHKPFFNTEMWRYVRYLGYGTLYQSSRGARVRAAPRGANLLLPTYRNRIADEEDIGNVILFHKARFVPVLMPGKDIDNHFHFAHFVCMRDKVTNLSIFAACVQFTAGDSEVACTIRHHEAKQTVAVLEALMRNDSDRSHASCIICGDLNNQSTDEPCVEFIRSQLFSAYDVVGGPRWTAWYHCHAERRGAYNKYFSKNLEEMKRSNHHYAAEVELRRFIRADSQDHGTASKVSLTSVSMENSERPWVWTPPAALPAMPAPEATERSAEPRALIRSSQQHQDVVNNAQDFIFYDPNMVALHQVLDTPEEDHIDREQLFPNNALPSHHLPLLADFSFNDPHPDVLERVLKP